MNPSTLAFSSLQHLRGIGVFVWHAGPYGSRGFADEGQAIVWVGGSPSRQHNNRCYLHRNVLRRIGPLPGALKISPSGSGG